MAKEEKGKIGSKFRVDDTFDVEDGMYEVMGAEYKSPKGWMYPCKRIGSTAMIGLDKGFVEARI